MHTCLPYVVLNVATLLFGFYFETSKAQRMFDLIMATLTCRSRVVVMYAWRGRGKNPVKLLTVGNHNGWGQPRDFERFCLLANRRC